MDLSSRIALDQYLEEGKELTGSFVLIRGEQITEPIIVGFFHRNEPSTIEVSDEYEIFENDVLVYLKTRQFCYIDDIRHFPEDKCYFIHYHTRPQRKAVTPIVKR